jgi:hypothetical protein
MAESDVNAFIGFIVVGISIEGYGGGIVVADFELDLVDPDHILGNQHFQITNAEVKQGIEGVRQAVVEVFFRLDFGKQHFEHFFFRSKPADAVKLHDLKQYCGNHRHSSLPMGEDFASWVQGDIIIDNALDGAFFEITSQDRSKADGLSMHIFYYGISHLWSTSLTYWKYSAFLTKKSSLISDGYK